MIYPDVTTEEWCKRFGFLPFEKHCRHCKMINVATRPFMTFESVGLCLEKCVGCEARLRLYSSIPRTQQAAREWDDVMNQTF